MSESMQEFRGQLEARRAELNERVDKIKARIRTGLAADSKEQAAELENQEVLDALGNEGVTELAEVSAALRRMDDGTYGVCAACGTEIDKRRLTARPEASRCIACATANG